MKKQNEPKPKIKLSFDGCYNYKKLKEQGLVENTKEDDELIRLAGENDKYLEPGK